MTDDLETFRTELRAAGQPYSLWGTRIVIVGLGLLVAAQVLSSYALVLLVVSLVVITVGWVMLIMAFVRRRRWAKAHPPREPSLADLP